MRALILLVICVACMATAHAADVLGPAVVGTWMYDGSEHSEGLPGKGGAFFFDADGVGGWIEVSGPMAAGAKVRITSCDQAADTFSLDLFDREHVLGSASFTLLTKDRAVVRVNSTFTITLERTSEVVASKARAALGMGLSKVTSDAQSISAAGTSGAASRRQVCG